MSVRRRSVADPRRSVNVFRDIFCCGNVKGVRDATRTSRMGIQTIRTVTEELQMRYGRAMDINHRYDPQSLFGKFKQFDFSVASPRTHGICIGSHKVIKTLRMAVQAERMIHKSLNIFQKRNPAAIWPYIRLCVTGVSAKV